MPRYTRSSLFPDVNVWIALTYERHAHHLAARNWFQALERDTRLFFCRFTQIGFLRLLTNEAVMGRDEVMGQAQAWEVYDRWIEDARVLFIDESRGPAHDRSGRIQGPEIGPHVHWPADLGRTGSWEVARIDPQRGGSAP